MSKTEPAVLPPVRSRLKITFTMREPDNRISRLTKVESYCKRPFTRQPTNKYTYKLARLERYMPRRLKKNEMHPPKLPKPERYMNRRSLRKERKRLSRISSDPDPKQRYVNRRSLREERKRLSRISLDPDPKQRRQKNACFISPQTNDFTFNYVNMLDKKALCTRNNVTANKESGCRPKQLHKRKRKTKKVRIFFKNFKTLRTVRLTIYLSHSLQNGPKTGCIRNNEDGLIGGNGQRTEARQQWSTGTDHDTRSQRKDETRTVRNTNADGQRTEARQQWTNEDHGSRTRRNHVGRPRTNEEISQQEAEARTGEIGVNIICTVPLIKEIYKEGITLAKNSTLIINSLNSIGKGTNEVTPIILYSTPWSIYKSYHSYIGKSRMYSKGYFTSAEKAADYDRNSRNTDSAGLNAAASTKTADFDRNNNENTNAGHSVAANIGNESEKHGATRKTDGLDRNNNMNSDSTGQAAAASNKNHGAANIDNEPEKHGATRKVDGLDRNNNVSTDSTGQASVANNGNHGDTKIDQTASNYYEVIKFMTCTSCNEYRIVIGSTVTSTDASTKNPNGANNEASTGKDDVDLDCLYGMQPRTHARGDMDRTQTSGPNITGDKNSRKDVTDNPCRQEPVKKNPEGNPERPQ